MKLIRLAAAGALALVVISLGVVVADDDGAPTFPPDVPTPPPGVEWHCETEELGNSFFSEFCETEPWVVDDD